MAQSSKVQLYSHDVTGIVTDIWKSNDIMQEQRVNGVKQKVSLRDYLNVNFFTFRKELKSVENKKKYGNYNEWLKAAFKSIDTSFARCKIIAEENTIATDIDFGAYTVDFEIIIQPEKLEALEKYWNNVRKLFLGQTYPITTINGKVTQFFVTFGNLVPEDGIDTSQFGKSIILRATIAMTTLVDGLTYNDYELRLLFSDDPLNAWYRVAFTSLIFGMVNSGEKVNTQAFPHLIGHIPQVTGLTMSVTVFDMRNGANGRLSDIAMRSVSLAERTVSEATDTVKGFEKVIDYEPPVIQCRLFNRQTKKEYMTSCYPISIEKTIVNGSFAALNVTFTLAAQNVDYLNYGV